MATQAHCAYAFECLAATFEQRQPLSLAQVDHLWKQYQTGDTEADQADSGAQDDDEVGDEEMTDVEDGYSTPAKPAAISRLLNKDGPASAGSSSSSLPSMKSSSSSTPSSSSGVATPASSSSSQSAKRGGYPLFVTWNAVSRSGHKSLRGCIGTFEPQELEYGLRSYALTSAFDDVRFSPIPASLLPSLGAEITLLTNFSQPTKDPLDWTLGKHGIRISFTAHGRRYGSTYLPHVATEQSWTKEETLISLMRKGGWSGSSRSWMSTWKDGRGELVRYEGKAVGLEYAEWKEWRHWVEEDVGVRS